MDFGIGQGALVTLVFNVFVTSAPAELTGDLGSIRGSTPELPETLTDQIEAATQLNESERPRALKLGLLILAGLSAIAIFPASRLPRYTPHQIPVPQIEPTHT